MALLSCRLPARRLLQVEGEDRFDFLQGLVSNDVTKASETEAVYAAFLTPQGKFLCDFFIIARGEALILDVEEAAFDTFKKKLTMFKLRAKVTLKDVSEDYDVWALFGEGSSEQDGLFADPRLAKAGYRAIVPAGTTLVGTEECNFATYDAHRISLGLPDGSRDMTVEKSILLENGFDELNGVDFNKGCYMGQELTARTKYRALIKKRLLPVTFDGDAPAPGSEILSGERSVGEIHSGLPGMALATLKLDALDEDLTCNGQSLTVQIPDWMVIAKGE